MIKAEADPNSGDVLAEEGAIVDENLVEQILSLNLDSTIKIVPTVIDEITYLSADEEDLYTVGQANTELDERNQFVASQIEALIIYSDADGEISYFASDGIANKLSIE